MMNKFYRKYVFHKYTKQISDIAKRPLFIISEDQGVAFSLLQLLNTYPTIQLAEFKALFIHHIGLLAYAQHLGVDAAYYQQSSMLNEDKLDETLRKLSIKNTLGNDYGFDINLFKRNQANKLKDNMDRYRWGAMIEPQEQVFQGLQFLFDDMKTIYLYSEHKNLDYKYLLDQPNCLCLPSASFAHNEVQMVDSVLDFLK